MTVGQQFSFVVDHDVAGRMDRVILINDGKIVKKENSAAGVTYLVTKA